MINFLLLMILPMLVSLGYVLYEHYDEHYEYTDLIRDVAIQVSAAALVVAIGFGVTWFGRTTDKEIWDGQIVSKEARHVSCRHAHTICVSTGKSTICTTTYEHSYDIDWDLYSSTGETVTIDTIDRQGLRMPPRWGSAYIGEPFSSEHRYTNYILANPSSVLLGQKGDPQKFGKWIPTYPQVYDYYRADHFLNMGVPGVPNQTWEYLIRNADKTLGVTKQVNLIVILVPTDDPAYEYALRDAWVGGKKNDAIILIGSKNGHDIDWASVVSWTPNKEYNVILRDEIVDIKYLDHQDDIVKAISWETNKWFVRMHMKDFKWLMRSFQPTGDQMLIIMLLGIIASGIGCYVSRSIHNGDF